MTAFIWQTLALLGIAYFAGCLLGCSLRRMIGAAPRGDRTRPETVPSVPREPSTAAAPAQKPTPPVPPVVTPPAAPAVLARDAFRRANTLAPPQDAAQPTAAPAAATPTPPPSSEAAAARFERALSGTPQGAAVPPAVAAAPKAPATVPPGAQTAAPAPHRTPLPAAGPATPAQAAPPPAAPSQAPGAQAAATAIAATAAAAAVAAARTTVATPPPAQPVAAAPPAAVAPAPAAAPAATAKPDDFKRIRAIDGGIEAALHRLGVRRYADIARWKPEDVSRVNRELGFKGRVEQENWIEQAQILARGEETHYSRRLARGEGPVARPTPPPGAQRQAAATVPPPGALTDAARVRANAEAAAAAAVASAPAVVAAAQAAAATAAAAVTQHAAWPQVPSTTPPQVAQPQAARDDLAPRVSERAAFASRAPAAPAMQPPRATAPPLPAAQPGAATTPIAAASTAPEPAPAPTPRSAAMPGPVISAASSAIASAAAAAAAFPSGGAAMQRPPLPPRTDSPAGGQPQASTNRPAIGSGRDSLQRIGGINSEIERLLNTHGVTRYSQIAGWSSVEVDRFDRLLGHRGRIQRESWVEQAQILAKGGDTAFSRSQDQRAAIIREATAQAGPAADTPAGAAMDQSGASHAAARGSDLSSLRSVRSEAFRPSDGAPPAPTARPGEPVPGRTPRGPALDDLKRIRGVGVLIEKKLHSMGISRYDQIAGWSAADIDRVSDFLDFKGRIERENWVEQARILAAGGQTEFSRRIDRGEPI